MDITSPHAPGALPATLTSSLDPPLHPRDDGWTIDTQRSFIEALANCGSVAGACRAVGMHPSSAYRLRAAPHGLGFRGAWNAALAMAYTRLREVAFERAVNGVEQPVYQGGELVGTRIVHNDRLLMFLLGHVERNVPNRDALIGAFADNRMPDHFAAAIDALESPPKPLRSAAADRRRKNQSSRSAPRHTAPPPAMTSAATAAETPVPSASPGENQLRPVSRPPATAETPFFCISGPPAARFDPNDWRRDSGVDLVSTSARQALEPRHDL